MEGVEGKLVHIDVFHTVQPPRALAGNIINQCSVVDYRYLLMSGKFRDNLQIYVTGAYLIIPTFIGNICILKKYSETQNDQGNWIFSYLLDLNYHLLTVSKAR